MRIATKLASSFSFAVLVGVTVGSIGYFGIKGSNQAVEDLYTSNFIPVTALADVSSRAQSHHADAFRHVIAPDKKSMDDIAHHMKGMEDRIAKRLDEFRASDMSGEEKASFTQLESSWQTYLKVVHRAIPLSESGQDQEATRLLNEDAEKQFVALDGAVEKLLSLNTSQAESSYTEAHDAGGAAQTRSIIVLLLV